ISRARTDGAGGTDIRFELGRRGVRALLSTDGDGRPAVDGRLDLALERHRRFRGAPGADVSGGGGEDRAALGEQDRRKRRWLAQPKPREGQRQPASAVLPLRRGSLRVTKSEGWWERGDSTPHGIATASPSSWCVCQFRHFRSGGKTRLT